MAHSSRLAGWTEQFIMGRTLCQVRVYEGHTNCVGRVAFSSDDRWIVSGSSDSTGRVWDRTSLFKDTPSGLPVSHSLQIVNGLRLVLWTRLFVFGMLKEIPSPRRFLTDTEVGYIALRCRRIVSISCLDRNSGLFEPRSGKQRVGRTTFERAQRCQLYSVAYSPDNQRVVSGSGDMAVRVWGDVVRGETVMILYGHQKKVCSIVYSNRGRYIASASYDDTNRDGQLHSPFAKRRNVSPGVHV